MEHGVLTARQTPCAMPHANRPILTALIKKCIALVTQLKEKKKAPPKPGEAFFKSAKFEKSNLDNEQQIAINAQPGG